MYIDLVSSTRIRIAARMVDKSVVSTYVTLFGRFVWWDERWELSYRFKRLQHWVIVLPLLKLFCIFVKLRVWLTRKLCPIVIVENSRQKASHWRSFCEFRRGVGQAMVGPFAWSWVNFGLCTTLTPQKILRFQLA